MASFGETPSDLVVGAGQAIRRNAGDSAFEAFTPGSGGVSDGDKGDITVSGSGATWTIDNGVVTLAKQADMATASVVYRKTAGTGAPEVQTLSTLKTDLGLTGTNSGDQTSIAGITGTKAQFDTAVTDGNFLYSGDITQYTDELAQDAVGTILVDSSEIDFTYNDATPSITASIVAGSIDEAKLDTSVNASLDLADSSVQPNSSPTLNAITATSSITVDSSGTANYNLDRGANTNFAGMTYKTAGVDSWFSGLRNSSNENFHLRDAVNGVSIIEGALGATPTVLPVGKTAASNSHILYTGATGAGKYNFAVPRASGDSGIAEINTIQNSTSYVSGTYCVALYKELARFPITTLGVAAERDFLNQLPSLPRIYDGAALYCLVGSGAATPANSAFSGHLEFIWN